VKFKAKREKNERKKSIEAQSLFRYAHAHDHREENNVMLSAPSQKATFIRRETQHALLKKHRCLLFANHFIFSNYIYICKSIELLFIQIDYN
jgi:hypothetical protein